MKHQKVGNSLPWKLRKLHYGEPWQIRKRLSLPRKPWELGRFLWDGESGRDCHSLGGRRTTVALRATGFPFTTATGLMSISVAEPQGRSIRAPWEPEPPRSGQLVFFREIPVTVALPGNCPSYGGRLVCWGERCEKRYPRKALQRRHLHRTWQQAQTASRESSHRWVLRPAWFVSGRGHDPVPPAGLLALRRRGGAPCDWTDPAWWGQALSYGFFLE